MTLTIDQLNRVVKFLDALRKLSQEHWVTFDSYAPIFLRIDSDDYDKIEVRQDENMSWVVSL